MIRYGFSFVATILLSVSVASITSAQWSWDDNGNDPSKEWAVFNNWSPNSSPGGEPITIGDLANATDDTTLVDQNFTIGSLDVSNGADVDTSGNRLTVSGPTTIGGTGVNILVRPRSAGDRIGLDSEGITISNDAYLQLLGDVSSADGGIVELESGDLQINPNGNAGGHGTIQLIEVTTGPVMRNSGRLYVWGRPGTVGLLPGTLTITHAGLGTGTIDLDGNGEAGLVDVDDGALVNSSTSLTLNVEVPLEDAFGGRMDIGNSDTVNIFNDWSLGGGGTINFNGTGTHTLAGGILTVMDDAFTEVNLNGGTTVVQNDLTFEGGTFMLADDAIVQFDGDATFVDASDFVNGSNTTIIVNSYTEIGDNISPTSENFDWDGVMDQGETIVNRLLHLNVDHLDLAGDTFGGTLTINSQQMSVSSVSVNVLDDAWVMNGTVNLNPIFGYGSSITGDAVQIGNDSGALDAELNVDGIGKAIIISPITFMSDADVDVAPGTSLDLNGVVNFDTVNGTNNAEFTGAGVLSFLRDVNFNEAVTLNMVGGTVQLDNTDTAALDANDIFIKAPLAIKVATLANYGVSRTFGTNITFSELNVDSEGVEAGSLTVNLDALDAKWTVESVGIVNLINDINPATLLAGSDVEFLGTLNVTGDVITQARLDIGATSTVNIITANEPFRLLGGDTADDPNTIAGGTINGLGIISADIGRALHGFGTIHADVDFDGDARLLADGGILTVNGTILDAGQFGTNDDDGILEVTHAWSTSTVGSVVVNGGEIRGGTITIENAFGISGSSGLVSARVINNSRIAQEGSSGTLVVETDTNDNDWDGTTGTGDLEADGGTLELKGGGGTFAFQGTVSAVDDGTVFVNDFALEFEPGSLLNLAGGTFLSNMPTMIGGTVTVGTGTSTLRALVSAAIVFESTSTTTLTGDLQLDITAPIGTPAQIEAGATFAGGGSLVNLDGHKLRLADGADVDVLVHNEGRLLLGSSAGQTQGLDYEQTATGIWEVELGGTGLDEFDRMNLAGVASLAGTLDVTLLAFDPAAGDEFPILSAAGGIIGRFDTLMLPALDSGEAWSIDYSANIVTLLIQHVVLVGDYNLNGIVDAADYAVWRNTLGTSVLPGNSADGDSDGLITSSDYSVWRMHFGQTAGNGSVFKTIVPEPASALLFLSLAVVRAFVPRHIASLAPSTHQAATHANKLPLFGI